MDLTLGLTYNERSLLLTALECYRDRYVKQKTEATVNALALKISHLQCQPGGCPYCGGEEPEST